jgi:hypothetical protein
MRITSGGIVSINGGLTTYHQVSIKSNSTSSYGGLAVYPTSGDRFINVQHTGAQGFIEVDFAGSSGFSDLGFKTGGSERMRITSDGYVRLSASSGGIQFNGDTAAANALDDYEEGTWTPTVTAESGSYTMIFSPRGTYTKIGRVVTLTYYFEVNNKGTGSNACILSSLPFASKSSSSGDTYVGSGIQNSSNNPNQIVLAQNSSSLYIYENTGDPITATLPNTGTITYIT